jgi:hypothetical protein
MHEKTLECADPTLPYKLHVRGFKEGSKTDAICSYVTAENAVSGTRDIQLLAVGRDMGGLVAEGTTLRRRIF